METCLNTSVSELTSHSHVSPKIAWVKRSSVVWVCHRPFWAPRRCVPLPQPSHWLKHAQRQSMSDAIAIDTQRPWHHSAHKWPPSSVKSERGRVQRVEEYTNPAPSACFEHTEENQHEQWCQLVSHREVLGKFGQAVAPFSLTHLQSL